jgi:hypothetical protein
VQVSTKLVQNLEKREEHKILSLLPEQPDEGSHESQCDQTAEGDPTSFISLQARQYFERRAYENRYANPISAKELILT